MGLRNEPINPIENLDGFKEMALDIIKSVLSDILELEEYIKHYSIFLDDKVNHRKVYSTILLKKHYVALRWLRKNYDSIWFKILGQELKREDIELIIRKKINRRELA
jgi:hypothetical protein